MAGGRERELRRRIRSVRSTRKITKAMELIAASQIARAQQRIAANRPYREGMQRLIVEAVKGDRAAAEKLLALPERVERAVVLVIVGDRGLSGPYNSSVLRAGEHEVARLRAAGTDVELVAIGKKASGYFRFRGIPIAHSFQGISDKPTSADARDVAALAADGFVRGEAQQVLLVSMRFVSAGRQYVETRQLLPIPEPEGEDLQPTEPDGLEGYTEFEPDVEQLLAELAPAALESEVFTALLEGAASFHTSQQRAMAAATENADELVRTLTRDVNRARQDSITTEIMEIVGGAEALRQEKEHA
ncbi:MAG TPA: ATP synthase F1 subunit gamma [Acidimicrobiales bacterium]|nr:ATP synthase F1 subunit gamma [Acidimicrobiales bacterium]